MSRYVPNETACPVTLEMLALLMRSDDARVCALVHQLPEAQRAALSLYCFARSHMRSLGLRIARECSAGSLQKFGGALGEILSQLAENGEAFDVGPTTYAKRRVTLAKFAA